jgi:hypothetical protein
VIAKREHYNIVNWSSTGNGGYNPIHNPYGYPKQTWFHCFQAFLVSLALRQSMSEFVSTVFVQAWLESASKHSLIGAFHYAVIKV